MFVFFIIHLYIGAIYIIIYSNYDGLNYYFYLEFPFLLPFPSFKEDSSKKQNFKSGDKKEQTECKI